MNKGTIWGLIVVFTLGMLFLVYENGWAQRMPRGDGIMIGTLQKMPRTGISLAVLPEPDSEGAKIFTTYCTQCHVLQNPKMHSGREWKIVVERMAFRMWIVQKIIKDMKAKMKTSWEGSGMLKVIAENKIKTDEAIVIPTDDEKLKIVQYLDKHGLEVFFSAKDLQAKNSKELKTYKKVCSQCHDLPNPKLFKANEWFEIINRLQIIAEGMETPVMSPDEEKEVLKFLQENAA